MLDYVSVRRSWIGNPHGVMDWCWEICAQILAQLLSIFAGLNFGPLFPHL